MNQGTCHTSSWKQVLAFFSLVICSVICIPILSGAQVASGSLSGTVLDATGAVIPDARIALRAEATGVIRDTVSNSSGFFSFSAIAPGTYVVSVRASGFKVWEQKGIVFNQAENRSLPSVVLTTGATTETIEVNADITSVPLDTPESRMTLNTHTITETAVQGRNVSELIKVMPAMGMNRGLQNSAWDSLTTSTNSGPIGQYSASRGQPYGGMTMTSDGANILDIGNMGTQVANINQDQTAEVTLLNSTYGAEFAKGPVTFQAISKSGTNAFHGSAYLYTRNSVFNSEDAYFHANNRPKPQDSYYYPGFTLGGPVLIPGTDFNHNRDKLFFFTGFEYMKQQPAGTLYQSIVPTPEMLGGDFSSAHRSMTTRPLRHLIPAWCGTPRTTAFPTLAGHRSSRIRLASALPTICSGTARRCCAAALGRLSMASHGKRHRRDLFGAPRISHGHDRSSQPFVRRGVIHAGKPWRL